MSSITPHYYTPYESGEDTDDKTGSDNSSDYSDSDNLPDSEDLRIRREEDPRYALIRTAGPNFDTSAQQLKYMENGPGLGSALYDVSTNITSLSSFTYLNPRMASRTSLLTIKSLNRDIKAYPSPFNFQLKTPRIYKNVSKFQLVQITFPNNTNTFIQSPYFNEQYVAALLSKGISPNCLSTCLATTLVCGPCNHQLSIMEVGRILDNRPFMLTFPVPSGVSTNEEIVNALNSKYSNAPPLNLISYVDFKNEFQMNHDISILFNEPGSSGSKQTVMNKYYSQQHIDSFPIITDRIAFNTYYYPILKELLLTKRAQPFLNCDPYPFEQAYIIVLGTFLGLDSDIYYNLCLNNQGALDNYRKQLTFEYNPVNNYSWHYNSRIKQFNVVHNSLHPSIQNDINSKYQNLYTNELSINNLNAKSFQTLKTEHANSMSVYTELFSNISTFMFGYGLGGDYSFTGIIHSTNINIFEAESLHEDSTFTSVFNYSSIFGKRFHSNFNGHNLNFTNFLDYHSTMSSYYSNIINSSSIISSINGRVNLNHHIYVSTKYSSVLPYNMINSKSYNNSQGVPITFLGNRLLHANGLTITDPSLVEYTLAAAAPGTAVALASTCSTTQCEIDCCSAIEKILIGYYSCLPVDTVVNNGPNSLPYRLGLGHTDFNKINIYSTFFEITSSATNNIMLQMNPEQSFNNLDISMNENYSISNETTGQVQLMCAKILLQGIGTGDISETAIQNPIVFDNPLGKLDRLIFKMYVDDAALTPMWLYYPFDIGINEWNATFQIVEEVALADKNDGFSGNIPTIPIPTDPSGVQYMALTKKPEK